MLEKPCPLMSLKISKAGILEAGTVHGLPIYLRCASLANKYSSHQQDYLQIW
jgi:hypothetical protein